MIKLSNSFFLTMCLLVAVGACSNSDNHNQTQDIVDAPISNPQTQNPVTSPDLQPLEDQLDSEALINLESYETILDKLLPIIRAEPMLNFVENTESLPGRYIFPVQQGFSLLDDSFSSFADISSTSVVYGCNAGGESRYHSTSRGRSLEKAFNADFCQIDSLEFTGRRENYVDDSIETIDLSGPFRIINTNDMSTQSMTGHSTLRTSIWPRADAKWEIEEFRDNQLGELLVSEYSSKLTAEQEPVLTHTLDINFKVNSDWTNQTDLQITTTTVFSDFSSQLTYQRGELNVIAADGSSMTLNADDGDPATFLITISANESVSSVVLNWDDTLRLPCVGYPVSNLPSVTTVYNEQGCRTLSLWPGR